MTQAEDAILQRAQAKIDAKRSEAKQAPVEMTPSEVTGACKCGATVTLVVPQVDGRPLPMVKAWSPQCPACREQEEKDAVEAKRKAKAAQEAKRRAALLAELAVPGIFTDATFDSFQFHGTTKQQESQQERVAFLRGYADKFPGVRPIYLFRGTPGTGKGHLVYSIARAVVERHLKSVRVVKLPALIRNLRAPWQPGYEGPNDEAVIKRWVDLDLLVIDEVSRDAFYGQNIQQHLYDVVDSRLELLRPTILTSNDSDATLSDILRPAMMNRLEGEGGIIEFDWPSYRTRT